MPEVRKRGGASNLSQNTLPMRARENVVLLSGDSPRK
jgi:hypothetical protein